MQVKAQNCYSLTRVGDGNADAMLPTYRDLLPCCPMQDDGGGAASAQDEWGTGEGATVSSPLLDRARPYTPPVGRAAGDLALPPPAELPRVAVRAEQGGVPGDQGGPYYDYGGVWGADPVGETPKPYPLETAWPLPVHWGQEEAGSIADDTAFDEACNEVRVNVQSDAC